MAEGLSPRVRGNPHGARPAVQYLGSIPTRAGKPIVVVVMSLSLGSIPTRAGKPSAASCLAATGRVYPTRAGKPPPVLPWSASCRVYPHACGETRCPDREWPLGTGLSPRVRGNRRIPNAGQSRSGSIPRVRGNRRASARRGRSRRSIPTRAGKPVRDDRRRCFPGVYPHACGETEGECFG